MKHEVGDRVKIKSLDWYNENKNKYDNVECDGVSFVENMKEHCGKVRTISKIFRGGYHLKEDDAKFYWTDDMIEGLVEEKFITTNGLQFKELNISLENEMEWNLPQGYQFKDENGNVINATKIVLEKIKKEYPKTYEECCEVLELEDDEIYINVNIINIEILENKKFGTFIRLIRCRNAYWKIAGDEMGLGKPWKPDWDNLSTNHEFIKINKGCFTYSSRVLVFPTAEMRDDFSEHFKKDIEQCKEFL